MKSSVITIALTAAAILVSGCGSSSSSSDDTNITSSASSVSSQVSSSQSSSSDVLPQVSSTSSESISSTSSESVSSVSSVASDTPAEAELQSGQFVDSAVGGLQYTCAPSGRQGTTNTTGIFTCEEGDAVAFYIAENFIGMSLMQDLITPLTLFADEEVASTNLAQLLQSLDEDDNLYNGIMIDAEKAKNLLNKELNFRSESFDEDAAMYLSEALVTEEAAREHLHNTINGLSGNSSSSSSATASESSASSSSTGSSKYCNIFPLSPICTDKDLGTIGKGSSSSTSSSLSTICDLNPSAIGCKDGFDFGDIVISSSSSSVASSLPSICDTSPKACIDIPTDIVTSSSSSLGVITPIKPIDYGFVTPKFHDPIGL